MAIEWDGVTRADSLSEAAVDARCRLADAAKAGRWSTVLNIIATDRELTNSCRLGGKSLYAPLHQAAHGGAPAEVVGQLIKLGAWRTLQNARGERAVDVAERNGHQSLQAMLAPVLKRKVPFGVLMKIQSNFHETIRLRIDVPLPLHGLRLPELGPLLEIEQPQMWFPVPGMYGGFNYRLESVGANAKLVAESWSRVVGGSGQRHEITSEGSRLVAEGFVWSFVTFAQSAIGTSSCRQTVW